MTAIDSARHQIHGMYKSVAEYFQKPPTESSFNEKGTLTPEEFLLSGNQLVHTCPTWQWRPAIGDKKWPFFPENQQFLETCGVPCLRRVASLQSDAIEESVENGEWISAKTDPIHAVTQQIGDMEMDVPDMADVDAANDETNVQGPLGIQIVEHEALNRETIANEIEANHSDDSFEHIPDMEAFDDEDNVVEEPEVPRRRTETRKPTDENKQESDGLLFRRTQEDEDTTVRTRTYDVSITYDKYYRVPRVWLRGYDENQTPLTSTQVMEDISTDHAHKTVTVEPHPHTGVVCATIHPCRHGDVMKIFIDRMESGQKNMSVDQYMFLFLKFMSAVIPTIEFDYTVAWES